MDGQTERHEDFRPRSGAGQPLGGRPRSGADAAGGQPANRRAGTATGYTIAVSQHPRRLPDRCRRWLYRQIKPILAAVNEAEEALHGLNQRLQGNLRIHAPTGFGQQHLTPLAIAFQQRHPELNIELLLDDRRADVIGEGIDVAIRFGELSAPGTVARRLGELQRILVASPAYLAAHGAPQTPAALATHAHIRYSGLRDGDALTLIGPQGAEMVNLRPVFVPTTLSHCWQPSSQDWASAARSGH